MCIFGSPKIPASAPVVQRQAYVTPATRGELAGPGAADRLRRLAGVETGAQGLTTEASTTKRVKLGGDNDINPTISGGGDSGGGAPISSGFIIPTISATPQTAATAAIAASQSLTPQQRKAAYISTAPGLSTILALRR